MRRLRGTLPGSAADEEVSIEKESVEEECRLQGRDASTMREAERRDVMKSHERVSRSRGRSNERKRCDSFVNSLFEEAEDGGFLNASPQDDESQVDIVIKMWKNGFTINDGQLRDYTDSANRQFMDAMRKGELPPELQRTFAKEELSVNVEDRKTEEYSSHRPQVNPFSGLGHRLGSAAPRIITKDLENGDALPAVEVDELEPLTRLKIWLADGKRIVQRFNTSHRISDVRDFIERLPHKPGKPLFTLATSFPLHELLDETLTLQEAHLQNAVLVQKLRKGIEPFRDP